MDKATKKQMLQAMEKAICEKSFYEFFIKAFVIAEPSVPLSTNFHHKYLCDILQGEAERIIAGKEKDKDIIINIPFRSTKSLLVTVLFPAWCWAVHPKMRFITASYSAEISIEHATKSRDIINSEWYQKHWGEKYQIKKDQNLKARYENTFLGVRRATSVGGSVTGQGGDIILVDDPTSPKNAASETERDNANEWYKSTLYSRLNEPTKGVRIIIMQRVHEDDLSGYLLYNSPDKHQHICIPAELSSDLKPSHLAEHYEDGLFWKDRFSKNILDDYKSALGSYGYAGQLQQRPTPADSGMIQKNWFKIDDEKVDDVVNFVIDPAYTASQKNDPSALMAYTFKDGKWQIREVQNVRLEFPDLVKHIGKFVHKNGYTSQSKIYVEPKASGKSIVQTLIRETGLNVKEDKPPTKDKVARVQDISATCETGRVSLLKGHWNEEFLMQCQQFPAAKHDDMVDCLVMALNHHFKANNVVFFG
ncbi:MAG: hypothetical protein CMI60_00730 [Parvibaculum sp.]|nr:hypothetical protein [Parvibaculum sp.]